MSASTAAATRRAAAPRHPAADSAEGWSFPASRPPRAASPGPRRTKRPEVAVESGGVPATDDAVEGVGARTDRLDRAALPVGQVVPALVAGSRPVRQLVPAEAGLGQPVEGDVVHRGGPILVLAATGPVAPAAGADAGRAGGRPGVRSDPRRRGRRGSGRRARGGPARAPGRTPGCRPGRQRLARDVVEQVEADRADPGFAGGCHASRPRRPGVWRRPSLESSDGMKLWAPIESRVTPASCWPTASPRSSGPGLASRVTSASGVRPNRTRIRSTMAASSSVGRSDGVPPPR